MFRGCLFYKNKVYFKPNINVWKTSISRFDNFTIKEYTIYQRSTYYCFSMTWHSHDTLSLSSPLSECVRVYVLVTGWEGTGQFNPLPHLTQPGVVSKVNSTI